MVRARDLEPEADGWIADLERRLRGTRHQLASPDRVYDELREGARSRADRWLWMGGDADVELLARGEPLVDLGLASFSGTTEVLATLWRRAAEPGLRGTAMAKSIRIACLGNQVVDEINFPLRIVGGKSPLDAFLIDGDEDEARSLFQNGRIDDGLLVSLFERREPFAAMPVERWRRLIMNTAGNPRLFICRDGEWGPDLGFRSVQRAIFALLETAPLEPYWVSTLYGLLEGLDPGEVFRPGPGLIKPVLARWKGINPTDYKDNVRDGHYTSLSLVDEFRCMIAALYGMSDEGIYESAEPGDPMALCAHYGNADLTCC